MTVQQEASGRSDRKSYKSSLSPAGKVVQRAFREATTIITDSTVGKYLSQERAPEGHAILIAALTREILAYEDGPTIE